MKTIAIFFLFSITVHLAQGQDVLTAKFERDAQARSYDGSYAFSSRGSAQLLLTVYQKVISPQLNGGCLYSTSCSRYSRKAIDKRGVIVGTLMTADRLTRCNRFVLKHVPHHHVNEYGYIIDEP